MSACAVRRFPRPPGAGCARARLAGYSLLAGLAAAAAAGSEPLPPRWWVERGAVDPRAALTNDFAAANQGQLKWLAAKAGEELEANLRNGAGADIAALIAGFGRSNLYAAVTQGQVKRLALPFYERLIAEGCAAGLPWTPQTADDADWAAANIGQLKRVFAFDLDPGANGLPDWWELENLNGIAAAPADADADGDGATAAQEYRRRTDPLDIDGDADGVDDLRDAAPASAADSDADGMEDDWERARFGDLAQSGADDADGDGRPNDLERRELTDPARADRADGSNRAGLCVCRPGW